jgi:hypothetical protein
MSSRSMVKKRSYPSDYSMTAFYHVQFSPPVGILFLILLGVLCACSAFCTSIVRSVWPRRDRTCNFLFLVRFARGVRSV